MGKHRIIDADLDRMVEPCEGGTFAPEPGGKSLDGSLIDKDKLAEDFLTAFDSLGLLIPDAPHLAIAPDTDADLSR